MAKHSSSIDDESQGYILKSLEDMRRKLLDLTSRNRLLNFPINQKHSSLRIINELPDQLFQTLRSEQVLQFAPVPDPTKAQLQHFGYLEKNVSSAEEKATKSLPDAKTWAGKLGINTSYELLSSAQNNISSEDYELVIKARDVILEHLQENGALQQASEVLRLAPAFQANIWIPFLPGLATKISVSLSAIRKRASRCVNHQFRHP